MDCSSDMARLDWTVAGITCAVLRNTDPFGGSGLFGHARARPRSICIWKIDQTPDELMKKRSLALNFKQPNSILIQLASLGYSVSSSSSRWSAFLPCWRVRVQGCRVNSTVASGFSRPVHATASGSIETSVTQNRSDTPSDTGLILDWNRPSMWLAFRISRPTSAC